MRGCALHTRYNCQQLFLVYFLISSPARPRFLSSSLDTITLEYHAPDVTHVAYTVRVWSNTTKRWRDIGCSQSIVNYSCVVTNLNTSITITDLSPGHAYYVRFASPNQAFSQVSHAMETKELGKYIVILILVFTPLNKYTIF